MAVRADSGMEPTPDEPVSSDVLTEVESQYALAETAGIRRFLASRGQLSRLLLLLAEKAPHYFPESSERRLRLVPPYEDEPESLLVNVVTPLGAQEALNQLRRLDDDWWIDASSEPGASDLLIDVLPLQS